MDKSRRKLLAILLILLEPFFPEKFPCLGIFQKAVMGFWPQIDKHQYGLKLPVAENQLAPHRYNPLFQAAETGLHTGIRAWMVIVFP
jgi:hypothetical protein